MRAKSVPEPESKARRPSSKKEQLQILGEWRITEMDEWDKEAFDLLGPAFFQFDAHDSGEFQFIAARGQMDCRHGQRDERPLVEFSWEGNDECDPVSGRGWGILEEDGTMRGHIFIHFGDDSGWRAMRAQARPSAIAKQRRSASS